MARELDVEEAEAMRSKKLVSMVFIASILVLSSLPLVMALDLGAEISKELMCTCGCGKIVYDCLCDTAKDLRAQVDEMVAQGMTRKEILDSFHDKYGDTILATPSKSGLELVLWLTPVVIAILGTVVIYRYAKNKAPIPDRLVSFPIRDVATRETVVLDNAEPETKYDDLFDEEYRKFKEKRKP